MTGERLRPVLRHLCGPARSAREGRTDAQLLERFVAERDEAAFEVLVWRHGAMVFGVGRRLLRDSHAAEDAFQATFLTLARKAAGIGRGQSLAGWLYKVAYRAALAARAAADRGGLPVSDADGPAAESPDALVWRDLRPVLDEEVGRLPAHYRLPFVLCHLQGRTNEEAARQLGCPLGTVMSRLARARARLRERLTRRGVTLPAGLLGMVLGEQTVSAALVRRAVEGAIGYSTGGTEGGATASAVLTERVVRAMWVAKLKALTAAVLALGVAGAGVGWLARPAWAEKPAPQPELVAGDGQSIRLPAGAAPLDLQTAEARKRTPLPPRTVQFTGTVSVEVARVRSRFPGMVVEVAAVKVGDRVKKGQLLAVVWSKDLSEKKGALYDAAVQARLDVVRVERLRKLFADGALPERSLRDAERSYEQSLIARERAARALQGLRIDDKEIEAVRELANRPDREAAAKELVRTWARVEARSPIDGAIIERNVSLHEIVVDGTTNLFQLADLDRLSLTATAKLSEADRMAILNLNPEQRRWSVRAADRPGGSVVAGRFEATNPVEGFFRQFEVTTPIEGWTESTYFLRKEDGTLHRWRRNTRWRLNETQMIEGWPVQVLPNQEPTLLWDLVARGPAPVELRGTVEAVEWLRPGQAVVATVTLPAAPANEVVVPASALVEEGGAFWLFVQADPKQSVYTQRRVAVVRRGRDVAHVRSVLSAEQEKQGVRPLKPGERIVSSGAVELKAALADLKGGRP